MARGGGECPAPVAPVHDLRTPRAELEPSRARDAAMNGSSLSDFVSPVQMQMLAPVAAASNGGDGTLDSHVASPAEIEDAASMYCGLTVSPGKTVASVEYLVDSGANVHLAQTKVIADNSVRVDGTSKQVGSIRAGTSLQTDGILDSALAYKSVTVPMRQLDAPGARSNVMSESALIKSKGAVIVKSEEHSFILYQGGESARALVRQLKESGVAQPMVESNGLYRATFELKTVEMTANAGALTAVGGSVSTTAAAGAKPAKPAQSTPVPSGKVAFNVRTQTPSAWTGSEPSVKQTKHGGGEGGDGEASRPSTATRRVTWAKLGGGAGGDGEAPRTPARSTSTPARGCRGRGA